MATLARVRPALRAMATIARRPGRGGSSSAWQNANLSQGNAYRSMLLRRDFTRMGFSPVLEHLASKGPLSLLEMQARMAQGPHRAVFQGKSCFWPEKGLTAGSARLRSQMPCEVVEGSHAYTLTAELPGVPRANIKVEVRQDDVLVINAQNQRTNDKGEVVFTAEFHREIRLPSNVDKTAIRASTRDGILSIHLGKRPVENIVIEVADEAKQEIPTVHARPIDTQA
eukprot:CAMPEP_0198323184 /NCGR_PEP_ID=MMETSP1450-20131203/11491_1 /TAXON_ID=753684 ORGANISM="Madagascaria erythrocladiodes, Strain CCMP3234" /NCGR_SAMPLE_ID=MMETSP1450 /ASSEMBLY_ACC=CAM_ASM_001115 /LENGTH=225 /DNA_ID=CAMNT_0044026865 /DNA_START=431 /DNA_END=1108 /DNA_ORIENTATION=+